MAKRKIRLRGVNGDVDGKTWENENLLRAGRLATLEIVLDDSSVSRRHAEIRPTPAGWRIRDLGSTNGTFVNGTKLGAGEFPLKPHDIVRCGNVTLVVDQLVDGNQEADTPPESPADKLFIQSVTNNSWEEALSGLAFDRNRSPRPGEQLLVLLRAGHHLVHLESEEDLLHTILNDAVSSLDAQRGAIVLADGPNRPLRLRALATGQSQIPSRPGFSQNLAQRSFQRGESILCQSADEDPELAGARSIAEGTMASILCILLRTPRKRIGVLHLDRGPLQKPFSKDDLHLGDALAAHVSAGIESAQLLKKQRELFYATVSMLAQSVELRDTYTGGHTARVTEYSMLLGQHLDMSPEDLHLIRIGTPLHDIGKIGIDDAILRKPGKLTPQEFEIMKTHTTKGGPHPRAGRGPAPDDPDRPLASRTLGRQGLSRRPGRRADPEAGPHRRRLRRLRRHDVGPALSPGDARGRRLRRGRKDARHSVRPGDRRRIPQDPRPDPARDAVRDAPHRRRAVDVFGPSPRHLIAISFNVLGCHGHGFAWP